MVSTKTLFLKHYYRCQGIIPRLSRQVPPLLLHASNLLDNRGIISMCQQLVLQGDTTFEDCNHAEGRQCKSNRYTHTEPLALWKPRSERERETHTHTHTHTRAHTHARTHARTHGCTHARRDTQRHAETRTHARRDTQTHPCPPATTKKHSIDNNTLTTIQH